MSSHRSVFMGFGFRRNDGSRQEVGAWILNATADQMMKLAKDLKVAPNRSLASLDVGATALCQRLVKAGS